MFCQKFIEFKDKEKEKRYDEIYFEFVNCKHKLLGENTQIQIQETVKNIKKRLDKILNIHLNQNKNQESNFEFKTQALIIRNKHLINQEIQNMNKID